MSFKEPLRAKRRRILLDVIAGRYAAYCRIHGEHPPMCAPSAFASISPYGCNCRKRTKGRPKVAGGMCKIGRRARIITQRQEARRLKWLGGEDE